MLAATRAPGAKPTPELGSGADHTAVIRWLERLEPPKTAAASPEGAENVAEG